MTKPNSSLDHRMSSSHRRERCTIAERARVGEVDQEVPVRHGVERVGRDAREAELLARPSSRSIGKRRARERRAAERRDVGGLVRGFSRFASRASIHDVREHVVGEEHRLRLLEVRVAGHHDSEVLVGHAEERRAAAVTAARAERELLRVQSACRSRPGRCASARCAVACLRRHRCGA